MFSSAGVTIFIIFCFVVLSFFGGVVLFFFGKEKTILDAMMNIIFVIIVVCILFPWLPGLLFYVFGFLALHVIPY
ncbi:hypothetical protein FIM66_02860 [Helicobacter pylori]|nr:hypothetical protein [Helicobacter pylori]TPH41649.1 hypothetical protein FIM81_00245 [Helicobacter pylori]TPH61950.1 hypothetical protein FIM66_02860 [Helicobacter pylori]TPH63072.1 hypothetical protein FIM65_04080 [Helicobacter pylori]TPH66836.1 hypothetical protein FIM62_01295 [Helicobacter pylori]TPH68584.1 hypothetical protein FIM61_02320 [Helicobacter pylori]